ncbi:NirD/YgiW/YdeI family stress tolerance protein [Micavibrio aeruginosavorus]|uniref:NirD/YgiW/YdeI family stress tolerance protein n=1 Tax=Micavibrio aeruginosavorus TaxID=349221 RepID=UPI003F4AE237
MKKLVLLSTAVLALGLSTAAHAQYTGPGAAADAKKVSEVLANGKDDERVTLTGTLVEKVGNEKYIFADDTGKIRVDIDNEDFQNVAVDEKTTIEISGEIEKDFMETPEIDVDKLRTVK